MTTFEIVGKIKSPIADINFKHLNPDLDPEIYSVVVEVLSNLYAQFYDAGNRNLTDFVRQIKDKVPVLLELRRPYIFQFWQDLRDKTFNYRDYVGTTKQEPDISKIISYLDKGTEGSGSNLSTVWTPAIKGLNKKEKDLLTVGIGMGEMTVRGYNNFLTNKLYQAMAMEPQLPELLELHQLEAEEMEQLIWIMPGIMGLRGLVPKNNLQGYKSKRVYKVHPWSHYLPIWN